MRIGHYMPGLQHPGGVNSYVRRVSQGQFARGDEVVLFDRTDVAGAVSGSDARVVSSDAELLRVATELRLDVLHLHTRLDRAAVAELARWSSLRLVRTMHGHWPYCPSGSRYLKRPNVPCERAYSISGCTWGHLVDRCGSARPLRLLQDFRRTELEFDQPTSIPVLAISEFVKSQMLRSGHRDRQIEVLYLPAPEAATEARAMPSAGPPTFLFAGRIVADKGLAWLLRAMARARQDILLEVAGHGPQETAMAALARELKVEARVKFHGWLSDVELASLFDAAWAVVFPSVWHEPAGLITLEAAARGRAVIASRVGGIPEYAEALQNAILVPPNDVEALSGAITQLANDSALATSLGEAGRRNARDRFSLRDHLTRLDAVYHAVPALAEAR